MRNVALFCTLCEVIVQFEKPPCTEGHGELCAEWCCTGCGNAILLAPVIPLTHRRPTTANAGRRHAA